MNIMFMKCKFDIRKCNFCITINLVVSKSVLTVSSYYIQKNIASIGEILSRLYFLSND